MDTRERGMLEILAEVAVTGDRGQAIMNQEKRGQNDLVHNPRLPKEGTENREAWEALGIVFHADFDELFVNVTLPEGWGIMATDHSVWTKLVDNDGKERAMIFYKAAYYDRSAHINMI